MFVQITVGEVKQFLKMVGLWIRCGNVQVHGVVTMTTCLGHHCWDNMYLVSGIDDDC